MYVSLSQVCCLQGCCRFLYIPRTWKFSLPICEPLVLCLDSFSPFLKAHYLDYSLQNKLQSVAPENLGIGDQCNKPIYFTDL